MTTIVERVRLDRWLLAARLYKTRAISQEHCNRGHVKLNGDPADPGKMVKAGDVIEALRGERRITWKILALDVKRGSADHASTLYLDLTPPEAARPAEPETRERGAGRPTKREGREIRWLKGTDDL